MREIKAKMKEKLTKKQRGITLIALVITIIVLLILAGVSIAMLTGENGILTQAQRAKNETETAQIQEQNILTDYEVYINNATLETATVGEIATEGNKKYSKNGTAIIPEGFAIVPGLDDVSQGLVISDVANDTEDKGNQFVWVPVEDFSEFVRHDFGNQGIEDSDFINTKPTSGKYYEPTPNNTSGCTSETAEEVYQMYKSVEVNHGFYIGRYEAGNDGSNNAVSKKGVNVYNNIKWGNSMTDETGGAVEKARNFDIQSGHTNVTSTLVYGVQWDEVMRWLSKGTSEEQGWLTNSTGKGNYYDNDSTNNPAQTGSNDNYQMKHIYDLAGNVFEWTMEVGDSKGRVRRGGYYDFGGLSQPCTHRGNIDSDYNVPNVGFRLTLYL